MANISPNLYIGTDYRMLRVKLLQRVQSTNPFPTAFSENLCIRHSLAQVSKILNHLYYTPCLQGLQQALRKALCCLGRTTREGRQLQHSLIKYTSVKRRMQALLKVLTTFFVGKTRSYLESVTLYV